MKKKGSKLLKILSMIIVFLSTSLYIAVSPDNESSSSRLRTFFIYNSVPYLSDAKEEIEVVNKDYAVLETFKGTVTAYGPDCKGCVSGLTSSGYRVGQVIDGTVISTTITYNDAYYGKLRILAAAPIKFPYGTVIKITSSRIDGYILGIVLDTGIAMRNAWSSGDVLIDLLFPSEKNQEVYDFGRQRDATFEVLRYGY